MLQQHGWISEVNIDIFMLDSDSSVKSGLSDCRVVNKIQSNICFLFVSYVILQSDSTLMPW